MRALRSLPGASYMAVTLRETDTDSPHLFQNLAASPGFEPRSSNNRVGRVANYTTRQEMLKANLVAKNCFNYIEISPVSQ